MRLVFRRARAARGLLVAASGATLVATLLLTGLADYGRDVVDAGARSVVGAASAEERSVLVRGPAGGSPARLAERDSALRSHVAGEFAGLGTRVARAGYAAGRQLTGDVGGATPDSGGAVFASVVFLDGLADHADLVAGAWPAPGATPRQAALAEPVAATLRAGVGDRVEITDRFTGRASAIQVTGVWRPRDPAEAYWRLVPEVADGVVPGSSTYGPFVIPEADFLAGYLTSASAAWVIEPDLTRVDPAGLAPVRRAVGYANTELPADLGLDSSALVTTRLDRLADRLGRADLVGRSALVTPILLVVVLGGYALLLVAVLLTEQRRGEIVLLRARGAARFQLAGLAAREAALVVLPAAVLAPPLAVEILRYADRSPVLAGGDLDLVPRLDPVTWLVAGLAVVGCVLAMVGPLLRRGGTYVAELAGRSRPRRWAMAQRIGLDLALVALAVLGWLQLRQYSSPLAGERVTGGLGIDPLLAAAPTLGVLAGAVLALRLLPPLTRLGERYVDRRSWTATMFGMWQAGRRPHAGPVLLLALAVGAGTLAWCLAGTSERSAVEQADHAVGADLRLVESSSFPPADRAGQLAGLPGVDRALAAWRENLRLGPDEEPTSVVALDASAAAEVVRLREDLAAGSPAGAFAALSGARLPAATVDLPPGQRLTGRVVTTTNGGVFEPDVGEGGPVRTAAVFALPGGGYRQLPLGESANRRPLRFDLAVPAELAPARLAGFLVDASGPPQVTVSWQLDSLRAGGTPVDLTAGGAGGAAGRWQGHAASGELVSTSMSAGQLYTRYQAPPPLSFLSTTQVRLALAPPVPDQPVPVLATPQALAALRAHSGDRTRLSVAGTEVDIHLVGTVDAVPGTADASALLADLPSLATALFGKYGVVRPAQEWWLSVRPAEAAAAGTAAGRLSGVEVLDRRAAVEDARSDPYGVGARAALFAAALGAVLLAAMGIAVDVRATARRRATELAVLHTLGASPRLLARALIAEQAFLAGLGVLVGAGVGIGVAATMAPLVVLTPTAERPVPAPLLEVSWLPVAATAAVLLLLALALSALVARVVRRRLAATQLRIGEQAG
jgi:FtsX-like permease family